MWIELVTIDNYSRPSDTLLDVDRIMFVRDNTIFYKSSSSCRDILDQDNGITEFVIEDDAYIDLKILLSGDKMTKLVKLGVGNVD